jgi:tRNA (guanine-N7-)-methyltransferase
MRLLWPADWAEIFGIARPLIVEIGFGYATYLVSLAQHNPDANVIGFEMSNECMVRGEKAIERLKLNNVRAVHSTAETALYHLFEPGTIQQLHINFPDPWFKNRHQHRRLMKRPTLDAIVNRLAPKGRLYLATDILDYAEMCAALFAETPGLTNLLPTAWAHDPALVNRPITTKYEGKALAAGRSCYYFALERNTAPAPDVPVIKDWDMPHIIFQSPLSLDEMYAQFRPGEYHFGETYVSFLQAFRGAGALLFEVFVREPTIDQRVALILAQREESPEFTIKLGTLGQPRSTDGIHKAVGLLGDWAVSLHPDARIISDKVKRDKLRL